MHGLFPVLHVFLRMALTRPWQPLLILMALLVATGGLSAVWLINEGARQGELASGSRGFFAAGTVSPRSDVEPLTKQDYIRLRKQGFTGLIGISQRDITLSCGDNGNDRKQSKNAKTVTLTGIDETALMSLPDKTVQSRTFNSASGGSALFDSGNRGNSSGIVSYAAPGFITGFTCDNQELYGDGTPVRQPVSVQGLPEDILVTGLQNFYRKEITPDNTPLSALIVAGDPDDQQIAQLKSALPAHLTFIPPPVQAETGTLSASFRLNLQAMGMLMAVVALFIILNALMLMYRARLATIIRLRQLGTAKQTLLTALFAELILYCFIAAPAGVFCGLGLTRGLTPVLQSVFAGLFDGVFISPSPFIVQLVLLAWLISVIALAIFFAIPVKQLSGALSLRRFSEGQTTLSVAGRLFTTVIVTGIAAGFDFSAGSTLTALVSTGAVLLSGCVLVILWLPALTAMVCKLVPSSMPVLSYVAAGTHRLSAKSKLAVCAFFIALTANTGMNVMTDSFRQATEDWLMQRLSAPAYFYSDAPSPPELIDDEVQTRSVYEGRGIIRLNVPSTERRLAVSVKSFPVDDIARKSLALYSSAEQAWSQFVSREGIFVNQQLAFRLNIRPGDSVVLSDIQTDDGTLVSLSGKTSGDAFLIAGIYPDYGNPEAQLLLPLPAFSPPSGYAGLSAIYYDNQALSGHKPDLSKLASAGTLYFTGELITRSMATFDRTFVVTDALNVATLLVAGLAFAISVSVLTLDLRPELNVLRAMGVGQWRLRLVLIFQYMLLCLLAGLMALPAGIVLAHVFIFQVNRYAFYWVYPLNVSVDVLLSGLMLSMAVVFIILLLPLGKMNAKVDLRQEEGL